jgi:hypothetical protein
MEQETVVSFDFDYQERPMAFRNPLRVINRNPETLTLIVEPWASEFKLLLGEECEVVAINPAVLPTWGVDPTADGDLIIWVHEGGSMYEFWLAGILVMSMTVPIPS